MSKKNTKGFTLLELVVVVIILGVLASLAVTRFTSIIEFSRASEALTNLGSIRGSIQRCYLSDQTYTDCDNFSNLDMSDPGSLINRHFSYVITVNGTSGFTVVATRNTFNGGDDTSTIAIDENGNKSGGGEFSNIR